MKILSRFSIFTLILGQLLFAGCAKQPSMPHIGAIFEVHGSPHIVQDNVCYYLGPWGPGAVVLKINYKGLSKSDNSRLPRYFHDGDPYREQVTSIEWKYIDEGDLHFYVPLLIESLKDTTQGGPGMYAYRFLYCILSMGTPTEYLIKNTPIDSFDEFRKLRSNLFPKVDKETYSKWKHWWDTKGHTQYPKKR